MTALPDDPDIERRCKICRDEQLRGLVNKLLGMGLTKPAVVSALEPINATRDEQITYDNVYHHQKRHFDTSRPAHAVYDAIVKKRAAESSNCPCGAIACNGCNNWWTGLTAAHCSGCHRTFTGVYAFDMHRAG